MSARAGFSFGALRRPFLAVLVLMCTQAFSSSLHGGEEPWRPLAVVRFGNVDAVDSEDGELASFVKNIKNDGRFAPPIRTMVGPEIRNLTFFGIKYEAWVECVLSVPSRPGATARVWVFPVDNRDEYMAQLANQGLSEYEGMDGVSVLRETDPDGIVHTWHMEWLPGDIAVFGADRDAVVAARQLYAENSASKGLLSRVGGDYLEPDVMLRLFPEQLATWRDRSPDTYWWRERVSLLTRDLIAFWEPNPARTRLIWSLSDEFAAWPRSMRRVDCSVWFEREGVEWRLEAEGAFASLERSDLSILRRLPEQSALAYALTVSEDSFSRLGASAGRLLLSAAGGVVTAEARTAASEFFGMLEQARIRQAAFSWIAPPADRPHLGGTRMLVVQCDDPDRLEAAWEYALGAISGETAVTRALAQIGWKVSVERDPGGSRRAVVKVTAADDALGAPYYHTAYTVARRGGCLAFAGGGVRPDAADQERVMAHREALADETVANVSEGIPDVRLAFTRVGLQGAACVGLLKPVRFMQIALIEAADLRPRTPDQQEPLSVQMAREMLEYGSAVAWTASGENDGGVWRFSGGIPWQSLARLSAALGVTESIGAE